MFWDFPLGWLLRLVCLLGGFGGLVVRRVLLGVGYCWFVGC